MWKFIDKVMRKNSKSVLFDKDYRYSYNDVLKLAMIHGENLKKEVSIKKKCIILCEKEINTAISILSCWYAKMIPIPLSMHYGAKHCSNVIELIEPDLIIVDNKENTGPDYIYNLSNSKFFGQKKFTVSDKRLNDVASIMCTSGTTGTPKGAMITKRGLKRNILAISKYFKVNEHDTIMIARPIYHCAVFTGEFLLSLYKGLNIFFFDEIYNPSNIVTFIYKKNITAICGTPTLFRHISILMRNAIGKNPVKKIAISGECLNEKVARNIRLSFPAAEIYNVYGLTEASPRVSFLSPEKFDLFPESVGKPLTKTKIKIVDTETLKKKISSNKDGLILIKSPSIMKGYYRNIEATELVLLKGWLNTKDIGYKDDNGYLYIKARFDEMIIKGGMNIYPKEIENELKALSEISDVVVYGVKCMYGQDIAADVVLYNKYDNMDIKDLFNLFELVLPAYLLPKNINIVNYIERNASGKIVRKKNNSYNK